ncbi:MAG: PQQ-dependent sugar dehydrogenase [Thermoleophilia bacterium]
MTRSRALITTGAVALAVAAVAIGAPDGPPSATTAGASTARETATAGYRLVRVSGGLGDTLFLTAAPGRTTLYAVQKSGRIRVLRNGRLGAVFLDIRSQVSGGGEQGLLGLAFHPGFARNRRFFVNFTDRSGDTRIVEYRANARRTRAVPSTARTVMTIDQPYENHNGGMIAFGPDRKLYIGTGDGGSGGDPQNRAQNLSSPLGKILRIDVDARKPYAIPGNNPFRTTRGARAEVWHYGLRNPWRFSFDRVRGDLWIGDVGQGNVEEVDFVRRGAKGQNFGWNAFEGRRRYGGALRAGSRPTMPVAQYTHAKGVSITGGYVYRGRSIPALRGRYLFADWGTGRVWSIGAGPRPRGLREETARLGRRVVGATTFGEDAKGELYIVANGTLYRFARR